MRIAILSDTHNDDSSLRKILALLQKESITTLIHCGDLTSPSMIPFFDGFQVLLSFGNCDYLTGQINENLINLGTDSKSAYVLSIEFDGKKVGIIHGNDLQQLNLMKHSGRYHYICTGHTHEFSENTFKQCRIINPGAAHSRGYHRATYAILNITSGNLDLKRL